MTLLTSHKILYSADTESTAYLRYLSMHVKILISSLLLTLTLVGCNKIPDPQFSFPMEVAFDIPAGLNTVETHYFLLPNTPTFLGLSLSGNGFTDDDVTSMKSQNARFFEFSGSADLDFINSIVINAYTDDDNIELFYHENIQFGSKDDVQLLASIPELRDFLSQEFVNLEVGIRFRNFPPANFRAKVDMIFSVYAEQ